MPKSFAAKRPIASQKLLIAGQEKNTSQVVGAKKSQEVEQVAAKVKHRAENPVDRSAELLLEEADVTNAGISSPQTAEKMTRIER